MISKHNKTVKCHLYTFNILVSRIKHTSIYKLNKQNTHICNMHGNIFKCKCFCKET